MGGLVGFCVGLIFLMMDWVECNQRDMLSRAREACGIKIARPKYLSKKQLKEREVAMRQRARAAR